MADRFPTKIAPMLATLVGEPFDGRDWLFETKWDGVRAIAERRGDKVTLYSRNGLDFAERYPAIIKALEQLPGEWVLDGEIIAKDDHGLNNFQLLQNYKALQPEQLQYCVFDILFCNGRNTINQPLIKRKKILRNLLKHHRVTQLHYSTDTRGAGKKFFAEQTKAGQEGIVAKRINSAYQPGVRGRDWLKIKARLEQEVVVGGFTAPLKNRSEFGALAIGVYHNGQLEFVGQVGSGFDGAGLKAAKAKLMPLIARESPFAKPPKTNTKATWVKPTLVAEVAFEQWTTSGELRQPIFLGWRDDKAPTEVHREQPKTLDSAVTSDEILTHPDKIYYPKDGYTKADLVAYYHAVAPILLPYLKDRPLNLNRFPHGLAGDNFYERDVRDHPDFIETIGIKALEPPHHESHYIIARDEQTLEYLVNIGCLELNSWNARIHHLDQPDYLVIDLDPEEAPFRAVVDTALAVKKVCDQLRLPSFCKTSGKRGLHIFVPVGAKYHTDSIREFAEKLVTRVHHTMPELTSIERLPAKRRGKVYLDYLQNRIHQSVAAAYSPRPVDGATVSTPLAWREVTNQLNPHDFTIKTVPERLKKGGDPWRGIFRKTAKLPKI